MTPVQRQQCYTAEHICTGESEIYVNFINAKYTWTNKFKETIFSLQPGSTFKINCGKMAPYYSADFFPAHTWSRVWGSGLGSILAYRSSTELLTKFQLQGQILILVSTALLHSAPKVYTGVSDGIIFQEPRLRESCISLLHKNSTVLLKKFPAPAHNRCLLRTLILESSQHW